MTTQILFIFLNFFFSFGMKVVSVYLVSHKYQPIKVQAIWLLLTPLLPFKPRKAPHKYSSRWRRKNFSYPTWNIWE